jgi:EAL and modified HD-GYP domain-containing signal transduction protein
MEAYVARQPILDETLGLHAYELLYRPHKTAQAAHVLDPNVAASQVIVGALSNIGLDELIGGARAFVNITGNLLASGIGDLLPPDRTVVELLEHVEPTPEVVEAVRTLKQRGYRVALDDFEYHPRFEPLLQLADVIKLDVLNRSPAEIAASIEPLRANGRGDRLQLLAERVETHEVFEACRDLGCTLFQGYFFSRPHTVTGRDIPASKVAALRLLGALNDPTAEFNDFEAVFRTDVSLSYKLLRYLNSPANGLRREVSSIQQALVLLGVNTLRKWASLVLFCESAEEKPPALVQGALSRARFCEHLARHVDLEATSAFTVGMFSLLDALLDRPKEEVLARLPLDAAVDRALREGEGKLGLLLRLAQAWERGDWPGVESARAGLGLDPDAATEAYVEAARWAGEMSQAA